MISRIVIIFLFITCLIIFAGCSPITEKNMEATTSLPIKKFEEGEKNVAITTSLPTNNFEKRDKNMSAFTLEPLSVTTNDIKSIGYANTEGNKIIACDSHEGKDNNFDLTRFSYAIGDDDTVHEIKYIGHQEETEENDHRCRASNFNNQSGYIYSVIESDNSISYGSYILFSDGWETKLLKRKNIDSTWSRIFIDECEKNAGRKSAYSCLMAQYEGDINVGMIEFERHGNDLLTWVLLERNSEIDYFAFPAILDESSCTGWRADDNGKVEGRTYIHTVFEIGDNIIVYLGWFNEETEIIHEIIFPKEGEAKEKVIGGRYIAP